MKLSVISFTEAGIGLSKKIRDCFIDEVQEIALYTKHKRFSSIREFNHGKKEDKKSTSNFFEDHIVENLPACDSNVVSYVNETLSQWTRERFLNHHGLIFIGACGIAVRAIAPYVKDKLGDSPVLVIDEKGGFIIPILSGHYGGGNELAKVLAEKINATPVITTATDVNGLFAVDVFAKQNNLVIINREGIERISSSVLAGEEVTIAIYSDLPVPDLEGSLYAPIVPYKGCLPKELTFVSYSDERQVSILISPFVADKGKAILQLCPKGYIIGIGCRRGKSFEEIEKFIKQEVVQLGIMWEAIIGIASIDRKKDEIGLVEFSKRYGLPFQTFTSGTLKKVEGEFRASSFVTEQVGVDNVCERAAMAACQENGKLVRKKTAFDGITVAIAEKKWSVIFDET